MNSIYGDVAEARLRAANLDVLPFALVALERNAWQPADRVRYIGVRQTGNDIGRQDLNYIVCGALDIERLNFTPFAVGMHSYRLVLRSELKHSVNLQRLAWTHVDAA